eukprot:861423_1
MLFHYLLLWCLHVCSIMGTNHNRNNHLPAAHRDIFDEVDFYDNNDYLYYDDSDYEQYYSDTMVAELQNELIRSEYDSLESQYNEFKSYDNDIDSAQQYDEIDSKLGKSKSKSKQSKSTESVVELAMESEPASPEIHHMPAPIKPIPA